MSASVTGEFAKLKDFIARMKQAPRVAAIKIAERAAPAINDLAKATFAAGENAFGDKWDLGKDGEAITLRKSGALARTVYYSAIGERLRAVLGVPWAKYQIGKRPVLPRGALPVAYVGALKRITSDVFSTLLGGAS